MPAISDQRPQERDSPAPRRGAVQRSWSSSPSSRARAAPSCAPRCKQHPHRCGRRPVVPGTEKGGTAIIDKREMQFLCPAGDDSCSMDNAAYEQLKVGARRLGDAPTTSSRRHHQPGNVRRRDRRASDARPRSSSPSARPSPASRRPGVGRPQAGHARDRQGHPGAAVRQPRRTAQGRHPHRRIHHPGLSTSAAEDDMVHTGLAQARERTLTPAPRGGCEGSRAAQGRGRPARGPRSVRLVVGQRGRRTSRPRSMGARRLRQGLDPLERMPGSTAPCCGWPASSGWTGPTCPAARGQLRAVELAKRFSSEDSGRFGNGLLSAIKRRPSSAGWAEGWRWFLRPWQPADPEALLAASLDPDMHSVDVHSPARWLGRRRGPLDRRDGQLRRRGPGSRSGRRRGDRRGDGCWARWAPRSWPGHRPSDGGCWPAAGCEALPPGRCGCSSPGCWAADAWPTELVADIDRAESGVTRHRPPRRLRARARPHARPRLARRARLAPTPPRQLARLARPAAPDFTDSPTSPATAGSADAEMPLLRYLVAAVRATGGVPDISLAEAASGARMLFAGHLIGRIEPSQTSCLHALTSSPAPGARRRWPPCAPMPHTSPPSSSPSTPEHDGHAHILMRTKQNKSPAQQPLGTRSTHGADPQVSTTPTPSGPRQQNTLHGLADQAGRCCWQWGESTARQQKPASL